jgi:hypothetical protein
LSASSAISAQVCLEVLALVRSDRRLGTGVDRGEDASSSRRAERGCGEPSQRRPIPDHAPPIDKLNVVKIDWEKFSREDAARAKGEWLGLFTP